MKKKITKKPVKKAVKRAKQIRVDPIQEYRELVKTQGLAQVSQLSNDECVTNIPGRVSTGSIALDCVLRNPREPEDWLGIPLSRITEIFGPPHIGKSTLLDQTFASVQKQGGVAILADTETSRDRHYVQRLHVDIDRLNYLEFTPENRTIENVLKVIEQTIDFWKPKPLPVVIGWDALGSTATQDELDKGIVSEKNHQPGAAAKAMALAQRIVAPKLAGSRIALVILNHEYESINAGHFQKKRETYGGNAPKHMSSLRVQLYSGGNWIKLPDGTVLGREVVAKILKNRLGEAMREAVLPMITGYGTEDLYSILVDFKRRKIVSTAGAWSAINIDGIEVTFQGWAGLRAKCAEIPELEPAMRKLYLKANEHEPHF